MQYASWIDDMGNSHTIVTDITKYYEDFLKPQIKSWEPLQLEVAKKIFGKEPCLGWNLGNMGSAGGPYMSRNLECTHGTNGCYPWNGVFAPQWSTRMTDAWEIVKWMDTNNHWGAFVIYLNRIISERMNFDVHQSQTFRYVEPKDIVSAALKVANNPHEMNRDYNSGDTKANG